MSKKQQISLRSARFAFVVLAVSSVFGSGCSLGMFTDSGIDKKIRDAMGYRRVNIACSGINLANAELNVSEFRQVLDCFNSGGALAPLVSLTRKLDDEELKPLVRVGNKFLLSDRKMMFDLESSYNLLVEKRTIDATLLQVGRMLENEEFVASAIALLRHTIAPAKRNGEYPLDPLVLKALERIGKKLTVSGTASLLNDGLTLAGHNAFVELQKRFRGDSPAGRGVELDVVIPILSHLNDQDPARFEVLHALLSSALEGKLFPTLDQVTGTDEESIRSSVPKLAQAMATLGKTRIAGNGDRVDAPMLGGLMSLFHYSRVPIECMKGSQTIANAAQFLIQELATQNRSEIPDFLKRSNSLIFSAFNPYCDFPPQLGEFYPSLYELATTEAVFTASETMVAFHNNGLSSLLIDILGYTGSSYAGGPAENTAGLKRMLPIIGELGDRGAWDDILYLASAATDRQREELVDSIEFLLEPAPELNGRSLYDVFLDLVGRVNTVDLVRFVLSLEKFVNEDREILIPAVSSLREAFHSNDVHPVIELCHNLLKDAGQNADLYETMFKVAQDPRFRDDFTATIRMVSQMAKDGQLKELIGASLTLFHKFSLEGSHPIARKEVPAFAPERRHNLSSAIVATLPVDVPADDGKDPCRNLDFRIPMDDYNDPRWESQISNFAACMNSDGEHADVVRAIDFLRSQKTAAGTDFLQHQIDILKALGQGLTREEVADLSGRLLAAIDDGRLYRMMYALPYFVSHRVRGAADGRGAGGPVLRPLMDVVAEVMEGARENVRKLLDFSADVISRDSFPYLVAYIDELADKDGVDPPTETKSYESIGPQDLENIRKWVRNKECVMKPGEQQARVAQIVHDYNHSVTSWNLDEKTGNPPDEWTLEEFKAFLEPLFQKFGDPSQSSDSKSVSMALLNVNRYFSLKGREVNRDNHYPPGYMAQWLRERSTDYKLITYYYPGERYPRARLVNSLDRLELVLINADMTFLLPDNFGFKFLEMIGDSWGDEKSENWPREVYERYTGREQCDDWTDTEKNNKRRLKLMRQGKCPRRIADTYNNDKAFPLLDPFKSMINSMNTVASMGAPDYKKCSQIDADAPPFPKPIVDLPDFIVPEYVKQGTYNIQQVVSVVEENLPGSGNQYDGGMKVLRDMFYELFTSSPKRCKKPSAGDCNNLSVIVKLVRAGLTRQVSRALVKFPPIPSNREDLTEDEWKRYTSLLAFFRSMIDVSIHEKMEPVMQAMFANKREHELLWTLIKEVFSSLDSPKRGKPEEAAAMKQLVYYAIAEGGEMGLSGAVLDSFLALLERHQDYFVKHADDLSEALTSKDLAKFFRALHESDDRENKDRLAAVLIDLMGNTGEGRIKTERPLTEDAIIALKQVGPGWDVFRDRLDVVKELPAYQALRMSEIGEDFLDFFKQVSPGGQPDSAEAVRRFAAARLQSRRDGGSPGDVEEILSLIADKPDDFYQVLGTMSHYSAPGGELEDFVKFVRRSLENSRR